MNDPSIQSYLDEKEKEFNKLGFFKIREDRDEPRVPSYPWSVLFIRYEAYCYDSGTTLEKYNKKFHNKLIRHKNGEFTFPKKATSNMYIRRIFSSYGFDFVYAALIFGNY